MSDDAMGLTQRELLMEMREDIRGLNATVDAFARDRRSASSGAWQYAATFEGRA